MTYEEAIKVLVHHQNWRTGCDIEPTDVKQLTKAIDVAVDALRLATEKWMPIESAPKDGTKILVGHFFHNHFYCCSDYWDIDGYWYNYINIQAKPTHWMHLKPPEVE